MDLHLVTKSLARVQDISPSRHRHTLTAAPPPPLRQFKPTKQEDSKEQDKKAFGSIQRNETSSIMGSLCLHKHGEMVRRALVLLVARAMGEELPATPWKAPTSPFLFCPHSAGGLQATKPWPLGKLGVSIGEVGALHQEGGDSGVLSTAGPLWSGVSPGRSSGMLHSSAFGGDPAPNECMQIDGS